MTKIFCLLISFTLLSSIYDFSLTDIDGNSFSLSQYKGKKILFVNTASQSGYAGQYGALEQLCQLYKDSLVVIAVPSNTFQSEPLDNVAIKNLVTGHYSVHYIITQKTDVAGAAQSPLYSWLTHQSQNGMMENSVNEDFYKFLVNGDGKLVGIFAPSVDPMSDEIQDAIKN